MKNNRYRLDPSRPILKYNLRRPTRPYIKGDHMNRRKFGIALGAAIAGLTAGAALAQDPATPSTDKPAKKGKKTKAAKHDCKGMNACKGQGGCSSSDNGCKGKNSCKGKGGCGAAEMKKLKDAKK